MQLAVRNYCVLPAVPWLAGLLFLLPSLRAQNPSFHNAPASAKEVKNPYSRKPPADAGTLFHSRCAACHGEMGEGLGNVPSLAKGHADSATDGEIFWYITQGDPNNGMPSWAGLPEDDRWKIVTYVRSLSGSKATPATASAEPARTAAADAALPPPQPPFTDFRFEKPGTFRKITLNDLPSPFVTPSAGNGPKLVPRPEGAWPKVPPGFKVELYVTGLGDPRLIRTAPNGDFFVAESHTGQIHVFRGISADGRPQQTALFAEGLNRPFGINFYPPGPNPQWVYVGNTDSVVRFPYQSGDMKARGPAEHIADLPAELSHWTRDIQFTPDGKRMFVSVGSASNVDDPDATPAEKNRADVLEMNPDAI